MKRVAICFFGITRSLRFTESSINKSVIHPLRSRFSVDVYGHFYNINRVVNARSKENDIVDQTEVNLIDFKELRLEAPGSRTVMERFELSSSYGDFWNDDFASLRNVTHQLYSLRTVFGLCGNCDYDYYVFVRPDLLYHDDIMSMFDCILPQGRSSGSVVVPGWQSHGGVNDRFSLCSGRDAAKVYAERFDAIEDFLRSKKCSFHSERHLLFVLERSRVNIAFTSIRASRVRANGYVRKEDFLVEGLPRWFGTRARNFYVHYDVWRNGLRFEQ